MQNQREDEPHGQQEDTARPMGPAELAVRHAITAYSRRLGLGDPIPPSRSSPRRASSAGGCPPTTADRGTDQVGTPGPDRTGRSKAI
jgi:hypothetical protein